MDDWKFKPGQRMSNHNPCHCGSGKPYQKCCKAKDRQDAHSSIRQRNLALAKSVERIRMQSGAPSNWTEIGAFLSYHPEYVQKIQEDNMDLWQDMSFDDIMQSHELLPTAENELVTVYAADPQPYSLVNNVKRLSTYVDRIIVVDPFHKPWYYRRERGPLDSPESWVPHTLKMMYFMTFLEPWISDGIVTLLPNPGDFDVKFRDYMERLAEERVRKTLSLTDVEVLEEDSSDLIDMARYLAPESDDMIRDLLQHQMGPTPEAEISRFLRLVKSVREHDPLVFRGRAVYSTMLEGGSSVNAEMHVNLAQFFGAFPSTFHEFEWNGLLSVTDSYQEETRKWAVFTQTLQELLLPFFDGMDNTIALELRREGYLSAVRTLLRKVWIESGGNFNERVVSEMTRELKSIHGTAVKQARDLEIDFSKGRWGKLRTKKPEILNDLGLDILYGMASGLTPPLSGVPEAALQVFGSVVWNIGRTVSHQVLWPQWKFKKLTKSPGALLFIRLDRKSRI